MSYIRFVELCALGVFFGMLLFLEVGRWLGLRRRAPAAEGRVIEGAVFGLLGLLVAFTFSGAAARFDTRRQLIVEETNAIATAYLRLDLLPTAAQPALWERFRQYVEAQLEAYLRLPDIAAAHAAETRALQLQRDIWRQAVYVILDLEFPRLGLIRFGAFDQALVELRESMR
jgi:hypothetical protein